MVVVESRVCAEVGLDDVAAFLVHCYVGLSRLEPVEHLDGGCVNAFLFEDGDLFLSHIVSSETCDEGDVSWAEYSGGGDRHVASFSSRDSVDLLYDYLLSGAGDLFDEEVDVPVEGAGDG